MQESTTVESTDIQRLVRISIPILFLGIIAILSPFAILLNNVAPPYDPPPPGWDSWVMIYLWAARFSVGFIQDRYGLGGGVTNLHALLFVIMTISYLVIQITVSIRKIQIKYGVATEIVLFLIWVAVCQLIYGTLQDWTLIQMPLLPIAGISILLVAYGNQCRR